MSRIFMVVGEVGEHADAVGTYNVRAFNDEASAVAYRDACAAREYELRCWASPKHQTWHRAPANERPSNDLDPYFDREFVDIFGVRYRVTEVPMGEP